MPSCRRRVNKCLLLVVKFGSQEDVIAGQGTGTAALFLTYSGVDKMKGDTFVDIPLGISIPRTRHARTRYP